jgi:hypothetical protein
MKIIDGGKKDYYDYLSGIYGIDNGVVYDRRDGYVFRKFCHGQHYFINERLGDDVKRTERRGLHFVDGKRKYGLFQEGHKFHILIEIGNTHHIFLVERYIDDNDNFILKPTFIEKRERQIKKSEAPISVIPIDCYGSYTGELIIRKYELSQEIQNPIFRDTWVTSYILPYEIYSDVYNYLISIKEPNIVDNRTDIQKLESKGFDKKDSFRNPVINANSVKYGKKNKSKV